MSIEEKIAIQELNSRYALHIDLMQVDKWVEVFSPDGVLDETEFGLGKHVGHDGVRAYFDSIKDDIIHQVHLMANHLITDISGGAARGTVFALVEVLLRSQGQIRFHVFYEDDYVKIGGEWKIRNRVLHKTFEPEVVAQSAS